MAERAAAQLIRNREDRQQVGLHDNPDSIIAASHVVATEFATVAAANNYWR